MSLRVITFDVTNTMLRVAGSVGQQYAKIGKLYNVERSVESLDSAFKKTWSEYNSKLPNFGTHNGMSSQQWWKAIVKDCFRNTGETSEESLSHVADHLFLHFRNAESWQVTPGADETLSTLTNMGFKLGIISNTDERLVELLTRVALRHHFEFVLTSVEAKCAKPDPVIFKQALELSQVNPSQVLHVGDDYKNDYCGAKQSGMKAVLLSRGDNLPPDVDPKEIITNMMDLTEYVKRLTQVP